MYKYKLNLRLFDGDGGGAAAGASGTGVTGEGSQAAAVGTVNEGMPTTSDEGTSFDDYIKEHKEEYAKKFQKDFDSRHRDYKQIKDKVNSAQDVFSMFAKRYNIDSNDWNGIAKAVMADDSMIEEQAMEENLTIDQYRNKMNTENELAMLRRERAEAQRQQTINAQMQEWERQSNALKQTFPDFDLDTELRNPEFVNALRAGLSMNRAFYAIHGDDIISGAIASTARAVKQATAEDIKARRARPNENGISNHASSSVGKDVHSLSKADRQALAKRSILGKVYI